MLPHLCTNVCETLSRNDDLGSEERGMMVDSFADRDAQLLRRVKTLLAQSRHTETPATLSAFGAERTSLSSRYRSRSVGTWTRR
jgi:hypothetical protein